MMAAGKKATADGSVLVARSCDATGGDDVVQVLAVPRRKHGTGDAIRIPGAKGVELRQVPETYAYLGIMMVTEGADIAEAEGGVNEHQVVAGTSTGGWLNPEAQRICERPLTSIGDYRMTLVLERCRTAMEGVELVGRLTDEYGARTDNYIVADPEEAWFYEEYRDHLWCAVRVPDDRFVVQANSVRIDRVDFEDPANFLGSENLVGFAMEHGLCDPDRDGPFNPSKVYGAQTGKVRHGIPAPEYDRRRIWRGISLMAPSTNLDPEEPGLHFSVTSVGIVRGALATCHCLLHKDLDNREVWRIYREDYGAEPFVRLVSSRRGPYRYPEPKILSGANYCDIGFVGDPGHRRLVVIAAIDNLMKGAAGNAVQTMNVMYGFPETSGLEFPGLHPI